MEPDPDEELFVGRREPLGIGLASDPENRFDKILFFATFSLSPDSVELVQALTAVVAADVVADVGVVADVDVVAAVVAVAADIVVAFALTLKLTAIPSCFISR